MATKTFEELKQLAIQIRDEKTNKQNTATRIGTQMLEHLNKLEQDYYDKTATDEELKQRDEKLTELSSNTGSDIYNISNGFIRKIINCTNKDNIYISTNEDGIIKEDLSQKGFYTNVLEGETILLRCNTENRIRYGFTNNIPNIGETAENYELVEKVGKQAMVLISPKKGYIFVSVSGGFTDFELSKTGKNIYEYINTLYNNTGFVPEKLPLESKNGIYIDQNENGIIKENSSQVGFYTQVKKSDKLKLYTDTINIIRYGFTTDIPATGINAENYRYVYEKGKLIHLLESPIDGYIFVSVSGSFNDISIDKLVVPNYTEDTILNISSKIGSDSKNNIELCNVKLSDTYLRFIPIKGIGKIKSIYLKNNISEGFDETIVREQCIYIAKKQLGKLKVIEKSIISTQGGRRRYFNGVDFTLLQSVNDTMYIGYADSNAGHHALYRDESVKSLCYVINSESEEVGAILNIWQERTYNIAIGYDFYGVFPKQKENISIDITDKTTRIDSDVYAVKCHVINGNSKIELFRGNTYIGYTAFWVDFNTKKIGFYNSLSSDNTTSATVYQEKECPNLVADRDYYIEFERNIENEDVGRITDMFTMEQTELNIGRAQEVGRPWGTRRVKYDSSDITILSEQDYSNQPYNSPLAIAGDSFIEGFSLGEERNKKYAYLIREYLKGKVFVYAQGGATSDALPIYIVNILKVCKPKFMLIPMGMNDGNYETWLSNMKKAISILEKNDIVPLLATIPPANSNYANSEHQKMNEWIHSSGYTYIDIAIILSKNYDGITINTDLLLDDEVHPNVEGNRLIFERSKIDFAQVYAICQNCSAP